MAAPGKNRWIGVVALIVGLMLASMVFFEIRDGRLLGSKSDGMTVSSTPVTFYISIILQGLVVLLLVGTGISMIRNKT